MPKSRVVVAIALILMIGTVLKTGVPDDQGKRANLTFERDVQPILAQHCLKCHNPQVAPAGLDLSTETAALKGSKNGPVIIRGSSEKSFLFQRASTHTMPPPGTEAPLNSVEIDILRQWIDSVAPIEQSAKNATMAPNKASTVGPATTEVSEKDRQFWAFQRPLQSPVPKAKNGKLIRTPIDAFLLSKLESKGLTFSSEAPKLTLMRRAYFDLIGLPPSPEEMKTYLADTKPGAYERLIDRLLASPHYGERWGRHWLDVAGYTDEGSLSGGSAKDSWCWRYRDYVIRSFNQDKPYDRFLTEQLAGDELVDWHSASKFTPETVEMLTATGYLRTVPDAADGSTNRPMERNDTLTRVVDNVSSGVLGLTGGCARCHDHKYDPIPQKDYYRMLAVFATAYNPDEWITPRKRTLPDVSKTQQEEIARHNAEVDRSLNELKKQLSDLQDPHKQRLLDAKLSRIPESLRADVKAALETPEDQRTEIQKYLIKKLGDEVKVSSEEMDNALSETERAASAKLQEKIHLVDSWHLSYGKLQALWDVGKPPAIHLLHGGHVDAPGMEVQAGFFSVLSEPGHSDAIRPADTQGNSSGRRLALAHWLTSPQNPLTARVIVNRIWQEHFGKGIVASPENFGHRGSPPTNQELLDWLAVDFMEHGWKIKRIHQMMMTSTAYRQSSRQPDDGQPSLAERVDPGNDLLWRMNLARKEAEVVRDSMLATSGKLNLAMWGEPVPLADDGEIKVSKGSPSSDGYWRRSVYLVAKRAAPLPLLEQFDFPIININCTRRATSTTPLQALTLLNSEFVMEQAKYFAARVIQMAGETAPDVAKIEDAYWLSLGRKPSSAETEYCAEHLKKQTQIYVEVNTQPEEASRQALTSLCQMLISTNEFLYVE